ncbi:MAG: class I SAM-dependent methyltransferase, partial [Chloroflexi bacterium]|nr:class I SAM-dependent methyltransferase [Chloroflexota bacterium]
RLMRLYFDRVYNPVYDFTTAKTSAYRRSQELCIGKLDIEDGDSLLCVGAGTGNEILGVLDRGKAVNIIGVDTSESGLRRTCNKVSKTGARISVLKMDAQNLAFDDGSFDKVFSHHLMGFLDDDRKAAQEMLRVLNSGGQYAITFPSGSGLRVLSEVGRSILRNLRSGRYSHAVVELLAVAGGAVVNIPIAFWVRPKQGFYSYKDLESMWAGLETEDYEIEQDEGYQNLIAYGRKL